MAWERDESLLEELEAVLLGEVSHTCNSRGAPLLDDLHQLLDAADFPLLEADDVHVSFGVLARLKQRSLVQQIEELPAVDFVEGNGGLQVAILVLR